MKYLWSVATGNVNPLYKASREAVKYVQTLDGFRAVYPTPNRVGTLWLFDSENNAKGARNLMKSKGIKCGENICRFRQDDNGKFVFDDPKFTEDRDDDAL